MREDQVSGDDDSLENSECFTLLYGELKRQAENYMRRQRASHTLQPTALVHEAYLKIGSMNGVSSVEHFRAAVAKAMKQILIDHARGKNRKKRSAPGVQVPLDSVVVEYENRAVNLIDLDDALRQYAALGTREAQGAEMVELKFFGDLTMKEISYHLGVPLRTLEREYRIAKAWLHRHLGADADGP